jgi:hypothetical protein
MPLGSDLVHAVKLTKFTAAIGRSETGAFAEGTANRLVATQLRSDLAHAVKLTKFTVAIRRRGSTRRADGEPKVMKVMVPIRAITFA